MSKKEKHSQEGLPLSATDAHILLVLASENLYGYAILKAVEEESDGLVRPDLGGLYRALSRLRNAGLVDEAPVPASAGPSPGRSRRYFQITPNGRRVLEAELHRLSRLLDLADARLGIAGRGAGPGAG